MTVVHWLNSAGTIILNTWGSTMRRIVAKKPKPWDWAASNCPLGRALNPPRTISAMTAEVNTVKARIDMRTLSPCIVKRNIRIQSRLGVQRKSSM